MSKKTKKPPPKQSAQIIGFRLPEPLAKAVKIEAARRQLALNKLFVEMWELYHENKRTS